MTGIREISSGGDGGAGSDGTFQLYEIGDLLPNSRSKSRAAMCRHRRHLRHPAAGRLPTRSGRLR
eukprot:scaffold75528_cov42-Phaeocystis_antarctica.AAC.1